MTLFRHIKPGKPGQSAHRKARGDMNYGKGATTHDRTALLSSCQRGWECEKRELLVRLDYGHNSRRSRKSQATYLKQSFANTPDAGTLQRVWRPIAFGFHGLLPRRIVRRIKNS